MSGMSRSSLSVEIAGIDAELSKLERELGVLKDRKKELLAKKRKILQRIDEQNAITANDSHWESDEFPWSAESRKVLSNVFHLSDFRPLQRSVINCVLSKEDALVVMSTGSGKSLCYQLPAAMSKGHYSFCFYASDL
ncbi:hypothetical protein AB6A40_002768 [Gnathostoma spinigerum]|uniref:DNA 3'-5' helicase n=1 Tax=Gnathostoma spinigerum TaxID=75299 RepID=A0ABD6ED29_9BILA